MKQKREYSSRLESVMTVLNVDAKQMVEDTGLGLSTIYSLASGRPKKPSDKIIANLRDVYGVSPRWLVRGEGAMFIPGRGAAAEMDTGCSPDAREVEMARYFLDSFSLSEAGLGKAVEMCRELIVLSAEDSGTDGGGEEPAEQEAIDPTIRLRKRYARRKAEKLMARKGLEAKILTKLREADQLPAALSRFILAHNKKFRAVNDIRLLDAAVIECQGTEYEGKYFVEGVCQFSFSAHRANGNDEACKEFGIVADLSFFVQTQEVRFNVVRIMSDCFMFGENEIFCAVDIVPGKTILKSAATESDGREPASNSHNTDDNHGLFEGPGEIEHEQKDFDPTCEADEYAPISVGGVLLSGAGVQYATAQSNY